jgi:hypothetical protein
MEEGKLGNEWYKVVAFAIFRLMLFPSETRVTGLEAPNVFVEYKLRIIYMRKHKWRNILHYYKATSNEKHHG